jgi:RNA polymerase sigma-70 factor (ECF subfamily)
MKLHGDLSIEEICQWDDRSIKWLYDHFYRSLTLVAMQIISDNDAAEDIVQDFFMHLLEQRPVFQNLAHLKAYFYNSIRNFSVNYIRSKKIKDDRKEQIARDMLFTLNGDEETFYSEEVYRQLFLAIDSLPQRQREVFLSAMQGKSNGEIATQMNIGVETVKTLKRRGKEKLRHILSPDKMLFLCWLIS